MPTELLTALFAIIAPVFIIAGIGFGWARAGLPFETAQTTRLVTWIGAPALVVSTLLKTAPGLATLGKIALAAAIIHITMAAVGYIVLRRWALPQRTFLPSVVFGNCGNMGLPLCLFAFGTHGLALAIAFFMVSSVGQLTVGQAIAAGRTSLLTLVRTPIVWAVALAVGLLATGTRLPGWAANTIDVLGQFAIPLMLLALGVSLARLRVRRLGRSITLALLRIGGGMAAGFAVAALLGLHGAERGVVVLQSSMPVAVFNYLFAHYFGNEPEEVAGLVVVSAAISFLVLPALLPVIL